MKISITLLFALSFAAPAFASGPLSQEIVGQTTSATDPQLAPRATSSTPAVTPSPTASATPTPRQTPAPDPLYGEYPVKYKDIIMDWLYTHLHDPPSAKIEWQTEPKRADLPGPRGRKLYGYLVLFTVNAKNQFGTYTGKQSHGILIHDDDVIKATGFAYNQQPRGN
jgi:hypothetical protein